jgi:subtilisin family serine protease
MLTGRRSAAALALACTLTAGIGAAPALAARSAPRSSPLPSAAADQFGQDLEHAWEISRGQGVTVAVLSTGVDPSIPGLKGRVTAGPDYTGLAHPGRITGSVVAGVIAGDGDLGSQTFAGGLAPQARILSVRVDPDGNEPGAGSFDNSEDSDLIVGESIRYAASHGAQVIFIDASFALNPFGAADASHMDSAIRYAIARGTVIVSLDEAFTANAADYNYPESVPGVIGVGAVQVSGHDAPYENSRSSQNQSILVAGPSNTETEPMADGQFQSIDGPEAAAAVVAGVAALVKSAFPHLSPALVGQAMALSARYRPAGGYNNTLGFGFINPDGALQEAAKLARAAPVQTGTGQAATATFRSGPALPPIHAVHQAPAQLAAYGAAIVVGLLCLAAALVLRRRRLRARRPRSHPRPSGSEQLAEPQ